MLDIIYSFLEIINSLIEKNFIISFIVYFSFLIFFYSFSIPGGALLSIASGYFFGFYLGFLINILTVVIGSLLFFIFFQSFFQKFFYKKFNEYASKLSSMIKNSSYEYLILLRLVFGTPLVMQNICISMLKISKSKIIISTFIGFTPYMILFSYLGDQVSNFLDLKNFNFSELISSEFLFIIFLLILIIVSIILIKKYKKS